MKISLRDIQNSFTQDFADYAEIEAKKFNSQFKEPTDHHYHPIKK